MAVAVAVGLVVGGVAGAAIRGSGSIYDNVLFLGAFVAVLLVAVAGIVVTSARGQPAAAGWLAAFIVTSPVASLAAYWVAPPYRSPDAADVATGTLTVHVTAPEALDFDGTARCVMERGGARVSIISVVSARVGRRDVIVLLEPGIPGSGSPGKLTLSFTSPRGGSDYTATEPEGLEAVATSPDGRSGGFAFVADRVELPRRSPDPTFDRMTGTVEWACR